MFNIFINLLEKKIIKFRPIKKRDENGKKWFNKYFPEKTLSILMIDSRAKLFNESLNEFCESMVFDKINGENFPWVFQTVPRDSFFTQKSREVTEEEFQEKIQQIFLKMLYFLKKK